MKLRPRHRGFTLIELLVVIAIMGVLAALIIVSLQASQKKAGDADRKTKAKSLATALEQRYVTTGNYPSSIAAAVDNGIDIQTGNGCTEPLKTDLVSTQGSKKYLESESTCFDKDPNIHHYYKAFPNTGAKNFVVVWQLKNQTEKSLNGCSDKGNGVYQSRIRACQGNFTADSYYIQGTGTGGVGTRLTVTELEPSAATNYFVVYGPQ